MRDAMSKGTEKSGDQKQTKRTEHNSSFSVFFETAPNTPANTISTECALPTDSKHCKCNFDCVVFVCAGKHFKTLKTQFQLCCFLPAWENDSKHWKHHFSCVVFCPRQKTTQNSETHNLNCFVGAFSGNCFETLKTQSHAFLLYFVARGGFLGSKPK